MNREMSVSGGADREDADVDAVAVVPVVLEALESDEGAARG